MRRALRGVVYKNELHFKEVFQHSTRKSKYQMCPEILDISAKIQVKAN